MENLNWNEFRHLGCIETLLDEKSYVHYQEYLQPSLFVHMYFTYTDALVLLKTYQQVLDLLGDSFQYHDTGKPITQREKALGRFSSLLLLSHPKFCTADLHDVLSVGKWAVGKKPAVTGGIGCAEFSALMYKCAVGTWKKRVAAYAKDVEEADGAPLSGGPFISYFRIRMPVEQFADAKAFLDWVLSLELLQSPTLFSATAGYCMEQYRGYANHEAKEKLGTILAEHPGFEYDKVAHAMGSVYSPEHRKIKPQISRINWLNALGKDALMFYPDALAGIQKAARQWPALTLHSLPHGFMVQAGEEPGIGDAGRAPEAYYAAGNLLKPFLRCLAENQRSAAEYPKWEQHYCATQD